VEVNGEAMWCGRPRPQPLTDAVATTPPRGEQPRDKQAPLSFRTVAERRRTESAVKVSVGRTLLSAAFDFAFVFDVAFAHVETAASAVRFRRTQGRTHLDTASRRDRTKKSIDVPRGGHGSPWPVFVFAMEVDYMASHDFDISQFLSEYRPKSMSQSFEDLLTNSINIREGVRSIASTSQQNLREFLRSECERDSSFPPVLRTSDKDFLGGSFARHTKNRPLDDIDIYLPLDGANLSYFEHGMVTPYTVLSDGLTRNPLLAEAQ
jgi:hypothetical protein